MTRELLLAVMPDIEKHDKVEIKIIEDELWFYYVRQKYKHKPNIYELAHKCKEWAHNKNYWLSTCYTGQVKIYNAGSTYPEVTLHTEITEPEAIFKACEWILKQRKVEL